MGFSKKSVKAQLAGEGLRPKKSLGQNFLIDDEVLADIVSATNLNEDVCVLEIGPGMGVLTRELAKVAGKVCAVELDTTILPILKKNTAEFTNVSIVNQDILKVDLDALFDEEFGNKQVKVIANLPYYITTPIIMKLLDNKRISSVVVMIQKEVAERLAAESGSKEFGAITLAVQYRAKVNLVRHVPPEAFMPAPKVWSSVVRLDLLEEPPVKVEDEALLFTLFKGAFSQRRKTFVNSVGGYPALNTNKETVKHILEELGICDTIRGEALSLEQYADIANAMAKPK